MRAEAQHERLPKLPIVARLLEQLLSKRGEALKVLRLAQRFDNKTIILGSGDCELVAC